MLLFQGDYMTILSIFSKRMLLFLSSFNDLEKYFVYLYPKLQDGEKWNVNY